VYAVNMDWKRKEVNDGYVKDFVQIRKFDEQGVRILSRSIWITASYTTDHPSEGRIMQSC
jgi:hypothetical protein